MNIIRITILLGIFQGILFVFLLLGKKEKNKGHYFLLLWLSGLIALMILTFLYLRGTISSHMSFYFSIEFLLFIQGPLALLYVHWTLFPQKKITYVWSLFFVPPLLSVFISCSYYIHPVELHKLYYEHSYFTFLWNLFTAFLCLRKVIQKRKALADWLLSRQRKVWFLTIAISYILSWSITIGLIMVAMVIPNSNDIKKVLHGLISVDISLTLYVLTLFSIRHPIVFVEEFNESKESDQDYHLLSDNSKFDYETIIDLLETEKIYLNPELTLDIMTERTGLFPSQRLSQTISKHGKTNFNGLINRYRIEEMKQALLDRNLREKSILEIAFQSGFNSKATFNRVFKQSTGISPGEFRSKEQL